MPGVVIEKSNIGVFARTVRPSRPLKFIGAWRLLIRRSQQAPRCFWTGIGKSTNEEHGCSSLTEVVDETEVTDEKELIDPRIWLSRSTRRGNIIRPIARNFLRLPMSFCRYAGLIYERSPVCDPRHWSFRDQARSRWLSNKEALQQEKQDDE